MTEFRDTRGVLKDRAALVALSRNYLGDTSLTDYRITVAADTGVHKEFVNIFKTHGTAVYEVFAVAGTIVAARDRHFVVRAVKTVIFVGVVKRDRHLGKAHLTAALGTDEDNVLHLRSADALGRYFAEHPAHSVGDIRFSASVRTDDDGRAALEGQFRFIREGFEALHFKRFEIHRLPPLIRFSII